MTTRFDAEAGTIVLRLVAGDDGLPAGARVAVTSDIRLDAPAGCGVTVVTRVGTYHELAPDPPAALAPGERWEVALAIGHRPAQANDGPASAFVVLPDGRAVPVEIDPMSSTAAPPAPARSAPAPRGPGSSSPGGLVPHPRQLTVIDARPGSGRFVLAATAPRAAAAAWSAVAALAGRMGAVPALLPAGDDGGEGARRVEVAVADLDGEAYRIEIAPDRVLVTAAGVPGWRHAFVTLARWAGAAPTEAGLDDAPRYPWRGLHVDLARRWWEPDIVEWLIDVCAWRKLSRLHLHLTDDEAWRFPVAALPALAEVGGRRGHGLPMPPMVGGGPEPYGRAYTPDEIDRWVARADALGVILVPEVDVPAHVHAALTAIPELRDPDDRSHAESVQHFVDNVLVPGHPATVPFLEAVFDALATAFPSSPWLHIGGDEVASGAWVGSPIVAALRAANGLASTRDVEGFFHRQLVELIRRRTGRGVGAWEEAAESGGVVPGDGYVIGWQTVEASRRLAAAGHDVVVAPAQAYYLDMALDDDWWSPGASWAGATSFEDVCGFDPEAGWSDSERSHLLGVQACLWCEHVVDRATMEHLLFPRLDAVAERAWTGRIDGGPGSLLRRAL